VEELLSSPDDVVRYLTRHAKDAKLSILKHHPEGLHLPIPALILVVRAGEPQLAFAVRQSMLQRYVPVIARLFNADMLGVVDDQVETESGDGLRLHLVAAAVDRTPRTSWIHMPYQTGHYGIGWDLPNRHEPEQVTGLPAMLEDLQYLITAPKVSVEIRTMEDFEDHTDCFADAEQQAALDIALLEYLEKEDLPGLIAANIMASPGGLRDGMITAMGRFR
jgi:hypothetical protein